MTGRKIIAAAALAALLAGIEPLRAGNPAGNGRSARILAGIEWGYDATVLNAYHYDYLDVADGFRVDEKNVKPMFYSNAHATAHVSLEFAKHFSLGLYAGYAGIQQRTRIFPLSLRSSYFFDSYMNDGNFVFLEGGAGQNERRSTVSPFGKIGLGRRISLTHRASMDFSASLRIAGDHPPIYDPSIPGYVPEENLRKTDAMYGAAIFAMSINF